MKLYEVNTEIQELLEQLELEFDPETGEILGDRTDEILDRLHELEKEKGRILEWVAKEALNARAEVMAIKAEEERLAARRKALENKDKRLVKILERECGGIKTDLGFAVVSYRKSEKTEIFDEATALTWLAKNNHEECIKIKQPELSKTEIKKLIKSGVEVPGVMVKAENNCLLK